MAGWRNSRCCWPTILICYFCKWTLKNECAVVHTVGTTISHLWISKLVSKKNLPHFKERAVTKTANPLLLQVAIKMSDLKQLLVCNCLDGTVSCALVWFFIISLLCAKKLRPVGGKLGIRNWIKMQKEYRCNLASMRANFCCPNFWSN